MSSFLTLDICIPSCIDAWTFSSKTTISPRWGMQKNARFASYPELQSTAASYPKNALTRFSSMVCAFPLTTVLDPPDPNTEGETESFCRKLERNDGISENER